MSSNIRVVLTIGVMAIVAGAAMGRAGAVARAGDWIVAPSYYTHDPQTGQRVNQYTPIGPFYTYPRADYASSGFHHSRSSINYGGAADNYFRVEQWGQPVRPYGEWQFPYRPYSVPFPLWDSPYRGIYQFQTGPQPVGPRRGGRNPDIPGMGPRGPGGFSRP